MNVMAERELSLSVPVGAAIEPAQDRVVGFGWESGAALEHLIETELLRAELERSEQQLAAARAHHDVETVSFGSQLERKAVEIRFLEEELLNQSNLFKDKLMMKERGFAELTRELDQLVTRRTDEQADLVKGFATVISRTEVEHKVAIAELRWVLEDCMRACESQRASNERLTLAREDLDVYVMRSVMSLRGAVEQEGVKRETAIKALEGEIRRGKIGFETVGIRNIDLTDTLNRSKQTENKLREELSVLTGQYDTELGWIKTESSLRLQAVTGRCAELESALADSKALTASLESTVAELREQVKRYENEAVFEKLREQLKAVAVELKATKEMVGNKDFEILTLKREAASNVAKQKQGFELVVRENADLVTAVTRLESAAVESAAYRESIVAEFELVIKQKDAEIARLERECARVVIESGTWESTAEKLEGVIAKLRVDSDLIRVEKEAAKLDAGRRLTDLRVNHATAQESLTSQLAAANVVLKEKERLIASKCDEMMMIENKYNEAADEIECLKQQRLALERDLTATMSELEASTKQLQESVGRNGQLVRGIEVNRLSLRGVQTDMDTLRSVASAAERNAIEQTQRAADLEQQLATVQKNSERRLKDLETRWEGKLKNVICEYEDRLVIVKTEMGEKLRSTQQDFQRALFKNIELEKSNQPTFTPPQIEDELLVEISKLQSIIQTQRIELQEIARQLQPELIE